MAMSKSAEERLALKKRWAGVKARDGKWVPKKGMENQNNTADVMIPTTEAGNSGEDTSMDDVPSAPNTNLTPDAIPGSRFGITAENYPRRFQKPQDQRAVSEITAGTSSSQESSMFVDDDPVQELQAAEEAVETPEEEPTGLPAASQESSMFVDDDPVQEPHAAEEAADLADDHMFDDDTAEGLMSEDKFTEDEMDNDIIERLLPSTDGPMFTDMFVHRHWDAGTESMIRNNTRPTALIMAQAAPAPVEESYLWDLMSRVYKRLPVDLFRYGLRLDLSTHGTVIGICANDSIGNRNQNMPAEMSIALCHLLAHPVWHGDIDKVRYVLQLAICYRVVGHDTPMTPAADIEKTHTADLIKKMKNKERSQLRLSEYHTTASAIIGPESDENVKDIKAALASTVKSTLAKHPEEEHLFMLTLEDVQAVILALNSAKVYGVPKWYSCVSWWNAFRSSQSYSIDDEPAIPLDKLAEYKADCIVHLLFEKVLRARLREAGSADRLWDVHVNDPYPEHFNGPDVPGDVFDVVAGEVYPPYEAPLPPRKEN